MKKKRGVNHRHCKACRGKKANKSSQKDSILSDAISNVDAEIKSLGEEKAMLKNSISGLSSNLLDSRKMEEELQEKIARLIEKEAKLMEKKKALETKLDAVADKANKIAKIKSEMASI